jgi:hypothetical protein
LSRWGIAAESATDVELIRSLVDRVLVEQVDWLEPELLPHNRGWVGPDPHPAPDWLDVHSAWEVARDRKLPLYGHFMDGPGALEAKMFRAILLLFADLDEPPDVVVVGRDVDSKGERQRGLEQAVAERDWRFAVVGALAQPEIEAWLIAAWEPADDAERAVLAELRQALGFDPVQKPERLSSGASHHPRDAKRTLSKLCARRPSESDHWLNTDVEALCQCGDSCGLSATIVELRAAAKRVFSKPRAR